MKLNYISKSMKLLPYNRVEISRLDAAKLEVESHNRVRLCVSDRHAIGEVFVTDIPAGCISFNLDIRIKLAINEATATPISVERLAQLKFVVAKRTSSYSAKEGKVFVCGADYYKLKRMKAKSYKIINLANGAIYNLPLREISIDRLKDPIAPKTIKLNKWIRSNLKIEDVGEKRNFSVNLAIQPSEESNVSKVHGIRSFFNKLLGLLTGNKTIEVSSCRPYDNDEVSNIVRLSKDNMTLLGIESGDNAYIRCKNRMRSVKVLPMDKAYYNPKDKEFYKTKEGDDKNPEGAATIEQRKMYQDIAENIDHYIGIPRFIRKAMRINNFGVNIEVVRNSFFILFKNAVLPFFSVVGLVFTIVKLELVQGKNLWWVLLILIPVILAVVLAKEKMKVK